MYLLIFLFSDWFFFLYQQGGLEASKIILSQRKLAYECPRIVALTANVFDSDKELCKEAGMHGFLAKPVTIPIIEQTLKETVYLGTIIEMGHETEL